MLAVIMAGGVGQRFWPRSRRGQPKQLLDLTGEGSMISLAADRVRAVCSPGETFVVTVADQVDAVARELRGRVPRENIVGEPEGRNTAPAIGLSALLVERRAGDAPFIVVPADHYVGDAAVFEEEVRAAEAYARGHDRLVTFGVRPTRPETGYGYIETGPPVAGAAALFEVKAFHEKPSAEDARAFVRAGTYLWNSGMFVWRPSVILGAIADHLPDLSRLLALIGARLGTEPIDDVLNSLYARAPSISIDYGVMERADNAVVLRAGFRWNDIGSWESVREMFPADDGGNVLVGDHVAVDSSGNTVFSPGKLVALVGVHGLAVVDGGDAILVCARDRVQDVRKVVEKLRKSGKNHLT